MNLNELVFAVQQGKDTKLEDLWLKVERFVWYCANRYCTEHQLRGVEYEDLVQCGYFALLDAVKAFNPDIASFLTYFSYWLQLHFQKASGMRTEKQRLEPLNHAASLDAPLDSGDPDSSTLADVVQDPRDRIAEVEDRIYNEELHAALEEALSGLSDRQRAVFDALYYQGLTFNQTAAVMGVEPGVIGKLQRDGLARIRSSSAKAKLERFLDQQTDFYKPVESTVIYRERLRQQYK